MKTNFKYLEELNEVQRKAVEKTDGPIMVIAGPGSGKTRVLTYKIAHLINLGIAPWNILALTFTNKAASEMKSRIEEQVGTNANKVWMGTFHSVFAKILRVEAHRIGFPNDFTIYDTDDTKNLIKEIVTSMSLDPKNYNAGTIRARISKAKSNLITPKLYSANNELTTYDKMVKMPMLFKVYEKYAERCLKAGAMDFDDLLLQMFKLLYTNPDDVRTKYQNLFKYILVDEFQDTNVLQYEIIKMFLNQENPVANICIVGDDAQSIYSFRGATIENLLRFGEDFKDVATYKLEQNYRSTSYIVEAANQLMLNNKKQIKKKIWTDQLGGNKIKILSSLTDREEGRKVSDHILEHKTRYHIPNNEITILYRTNAQSRIFEEYLRNLNIPYRIYGGISFYQRKEIKDILAYMRLVVNPKDDEAFKRIINFPKRGIGNKVLETLSQDAEKKKISLYEACFEAELTSRSRTLINEFIRTIESMKEKNNEADVYETTRFIVQTIKIIEIFELEKTLESLSRIENINALLSGVQEFGSGEEYVEGENYEKRDLAAFIQSISLLTDMDLTEEEKNDAITLMSVHLAKGLEFDSVFVVGLEENLFPSYLSLANPEDIEEERRLFYVAITRARKHLTLSYSANRYQYGQMRSNEKSRFLEELPEKSLDPVSATLIYKNTLPSKPKILTEMGFGIGKKILTSTSNALPEIAPGELARPDQIIPGKKVYHAKFGVGTVFSVDGNEANRIAKIRFEEIEDEEKSLVLRFAKLKVLD